MAFQGTILEWLSGLSTREAIRRGRGSRGEHRAKGADENNIEGACLGAEAPNFTQANLKRF